MIVYLVCSHNSERDSLDENAVNNEEMMNEVNTNEINAADKPFYTQQRVTSIFRYKVQ